MNRRRIVNAALLTGAITAGTAATALAGIGVGAVATYQANQSDHLTTLDEDALTITGRCPAGWDPIYYRNGRWYCAAPWLRSAYGQYYAQPVR